MTMTRKETIETKIKSCGTPLQYTIGVLEKIPPILGDTCKLVKELTKPVKRLYVRVNTTKISTEQYLELLNTNRIRFYRDEEIPEAIWAEVYGPFEVPIYRGRVIADKKASESVLLGSDLYAPGVIGASHFRKGQKVTVVSENGVIVGAGTAMMDPGEMMSSRKGLAVRLEHPRYKSYRVRDLPGYQEGYIYGQSISSMYVGHIVDHEPGQTIIDLTAAPGGKISHIAQKAPPDTRIIAVDRPSKKQKLVETLRRLGLEDRVEVLGLDSRKITRKIPSLNETADIVLVDPPCTNLGVRPKVYDLKREQDVRNMVLYQRGFIREAYKLLKPGGILVYSTCTLTSPENTGNIAWAETLGFELIEPPRGLRRPIYAGDTLWFNPLDGIPGFFIALLRKQ